jgi:branched-chain amino acid transport system ATP-binding protein
MDAAQAQPLLRLTEVSKSYGALKVTDNVSFAVSEGETLGILGPNGAGKTTLFNLISGDVRPNQGRVEYAGRDITTLAPHQRCRLGIGRSYQVPQPFGHMTVFENLVTAACFGAQEDERQAWATAHEVLQATGLLPHANKPAGSLTLLNRKRLELARALAARPRLLLLDEWLAGLNPSELMIGIDLIRSLKADGITIVLVEHVMSAVRALCDRCVVMSSGRKIAEGATADVLNDAAVVKAYLGGVAADA